MKLIKEKIKKSKNGCYRVIILFLLFIITIPLSAYGDECPPGEYFVNAFNRTSYYKSNGTFVSSAKVLPLNG